MLTKQLEVGQVIDVVRFDETGEENLRRVRIQELTDCGEYVSIIGVNMKGGNATRFALALEPWDMVERPSTTNWTAFDEVEGEE